MSSELEEATGFLSQATQPRLRQLLQGFVNTLQKEQQQREEAASDTAAATKVSSSPVRQTPAPPQPRADITINSYSWDENEKEVKLYFSVPPPTAPASRAKLLCRSHSDDRKLLIRVVFDTFESQSQLTTHSLMLYPLKHHLEEIEVEVPLEEVVVAPSGDNNNNNNNKTAFQTANNAGFVYPDAGSENCIKSESLNAKGNCRIKFKPSGDAVVIITKTCDQTWSDLLDKDDFGKPLSVGRVGEVGAGPTADVENAATAASTGGRQKVDRDDPAVQKTASLVTLMQQLYRDGDDTMKKTIAEAWEESRNMQ